MIARISIGDVDLDVWGEYSPETPDVWYLSNGDPGYPGEPEYFEINKIFYNDVDITDIVEAMNMLFLSTLRVNHIENYHSIDDLWLLIERLCIEEITK